MPRDRSSRADVRAESEAQGGLIAEPRLEPFGDRVLVKLPRQPAVDLAQKRCKVALGAYVNEPLPGLDVHDHRLALVREPQDESRGSASPRRCCGAPRPRRTPRPSRTSAR